jgi:hypothetical protein
MKKKQRIGFLLCCIPVLLFTFFGSYVFSRRYAEKTNDIIYSTEANVAAGAVSEEVVCADTQVVYELYYQGEKRKEEIQAAPALYVGKTRSQLLECLQESLENPSREELEEGLENLELISFSKDRVVIRKKYGDGLSYAYCLYIENGAVTVYYSDKTTVYSYTGIQAETLPDSLRKELYSGKELDSPAELYDFLETYSS